MKGDICLKAYINIMDNKNKLKQLLLLKREYKERLSQGDKRGAKTCLDRMATVYNEITGKNLWDNFSDAEKNILKERLDYDIEYRDISKMEIDIDTNKDDIIK